MNMTGIIIRDFKALFHLVTNELKANEKLQS